MKNRSSRWGCLLGGLGILLLLLLLGGGWWLYRSQSAGLDNDTFISPVVSIITSPADGDEVGVGDFVSVTVQSTSLDALQSVELFLDGQSLGKVTDAPSTASWTWQAWPLGIHSFYAQAMDVKGKVGFSQVVILNVLAGDGLLKTNASEGQTLEQIGAGYGVPPDQMAAANPGLDPNQPLPGGDPVQIPVGGAGSGNGSGSESGQGGQVSDPIYTVITWTFKPKEPVDKSYCYTSTGNGVWIKMPKPPFSFLDEFIPYIQTKVSFPIKKSVIQAQCWGWIGSVLKYLGQGESQFDVLKPPNEVKIDGGGFILTGIPKAPPIKEDQFLEDEIKAVPPPFLLREPKDSQDCESHGNLIITPYLCNNLLNAKVKQYLILEWEWAPKVCWPGYCIWYDKVDGYRVYEYDTATFSRKLLRDIGPQGNRVAAVPLPWGGGKCYQVEAYVNKPGVLPSVAAWYCPGDNKYATKLTLTQVTDWLTTEDVLRDGSDEGCGYTQEHMLHSDGPGSLPGFGSQIGEVFVGAGIHKQDGSIGVSYCYMDEYYQGGVKFAHPTQIPSESVIQKAVLRFTPVWQAFHPGASASPKPSSCVISVAGVNQSWSGLVDADHWVKGVLPYQGVSVSVNQYASPQADVTAIVEKWLKNTSSNQGFVLRGWFPSLPDTSSNKTNSSWCVSALSNFQLDIYYFAPP